MPRLLLTQATDTDTSIQRARTLHDNYGFREQFRHSTVEQLVAAFNHEVGKSGWVAARAVYLIALRDALLATGLDCSSFISDHAMEMDVIVTLHRNAIVAGIP
jgi:hypothetical protein